MTSGSSKTRRRQNLLRLLTIFVAVALVAALLGAVG
jgi:hypothetical protein